MKSKALYIALIVLAFTYASCNKISESIQQDIVIIDSVFFEVPVITNIADTVRVSNIESPLNFGERVSAQAQGMSIANLTSVRLKSMNLNLISAASGVDTANTFGKLLSVQMQIADGIKADSLASIRITSASPSAALMLTPVIATDTLKPYVSVPAVRYNVIIKAKGVTTTAMKVKIEAAYTFTLSN